MKKGQRRIVKLQIFQAQMKRIKKQREKEEIVYNLGIIYTIRKKKESRKKKWGLFKIVVGQQ